jgi:hypothetical protein
MATGDLEDVSAMRTIDAYFAPLGEKEKHSLALVLSQAEAMTNIAFIGVGNMGGPMARNLVKAGHAVTARSI